MMNDLIMFLTARLDEQEAETSADPTETSEQAYILADIAAKRRVVQRHQPVEQWTGRGQYRRLYRIECSTCLEDSPPSSPNDPGCYHGALEWPCPEIRDAASPFTDRPGYRPEWKP